MSGGGAGFVLLAIALGSAGVVMIVLELLDARERHNRTNAIRARFDSSGQPLPRSQARPWSVFAALPRAHGRQHVDVERELPQLIDVVRMGLDAGMSFETSFSVYAQRFDTQLAQLCRPYALRVINGVEGREKVMRELADELQSKQFERFVNIVLRSLRFGSRLGPILQQLAEEIRDEGKSRAQERISKAPTKMLLPTAVLVLPAMLILIGGPFLLELLQQM